VTRLQAFTLLVHSSHVRMSALKKIFGGGKKNDETEDNTSPGAEEIPAAEAPAPARKGARFAGVDDEENDPPKSKGGIKFAEPPPPDSKDSKKKKQAKPKHVRVVIGDEEELGASSKKTKSKSKSQPPPTVSSHQENRMCCVLNNNIVHGKIASIIGICVDDMPPYMHE